ncbi:class I SAM-dependent methyltransferase [Natronohydrobacter thiooxidans]|uniref:class I SAM-dependent methyltransferase n=1 Tax=Natronohydrobacter thiooxidans TaxID=87172 RepID=UPI0008FF1BB5|nr:class I SAM-dependent methyltransferase [Natronohydrobacter thiooxidans]
MTYDAIPGWFYPIDQAGFAWTLEFQNDTAPPGDLLELGTYLGKSAILMGQKLKQGERLTVCDLFEDVMTWDGANPVEKAFFGTRTPTRDQFEANYRAFHPALPEIVQGPTGSICQHVAPGSCRFVHIDASHVYANVREDTASARKLLQENGVVVFDDYRKPQCLGTAAAVWEAILNDGLKPVFATDAKLYATWGDPEPLRAAITARARASDWCRTGKPVAIRDMQIIRLARHGK